MKFSFLSLWILLFAIPLISQQLSIEGEVSMLALGDSYTIGESVEVNERWPHQFIRQLRSLGVAAEDPDYIATTGWTTRNLLGWIETKMPQEKDYNLVSILIGVNNQYQGIEIASYEPDLRKIIDIALEAVDQDSSRLMILSIPDYAYTPFGDGNENISKEIDEYNSIKRSVAKEYGITFIDITEISREGIDNPSLVARDGLHPSKEQYARWVQAIIPRLKIEKTLSATEQKYMHNAPIRLYPNPAGSWLQMYSDLELERIRIFNATGKMILNLGITSLPATLDVSRLKSGAYTLCAYGSLYPGRYCKNLMIQQ